MWVQITERVFEPNCFGENHYYNRLITHQRLLLFDIKHLRSRIMAHCYISVFFSVHVTITTEIQDIFCVFVILKVGVCRCCTFENGSCAQSCKNWDAPRNWPEPKFRRLLVLWSWYFPKLLQPHLHRFGTMSRPSLVPPNVVNYDAICKCLREKSLDLTVQCWINYGSDCNLHKNQIIWSTVLHLN